MIQSIDAPISVTLQFDHRTRKVTPTNITWEGRQYPIIQIGLHHTYRQGRTLFHIFSVSTPTLFFRLRFNTDTLHWRVQEIADHEVN